MKVKRTTLAKALMGAILGAATIFAAPVQAKDWKTVTIALEGGYAPWNLTLPGGKLGGFEPELVANLCERIKLQCNLVAQDWDGMIPGLQAGKFDVLMDAISITPEREKIIAFSRPYAATPATFAVTDAKVLPKAAPGAPVVKLSGDPKTDQPTVDALRKQLKGKTIGIQSGTVYTKFINDGFKDVSTIRGIHPHDVATILDEDGVAIRAGHHCCQILHDKLNIPASSRASVGVYNTRDDLDKLNDSINNCKKIFNRK